MAMSREWMKVTRDAHEFFLAVRTALGSAWGYTRRTKAGSRKTRLATFRTGRVADLRELAEVEHMRNLAFVYNNRSQVR
jgi:hypothetical protein